MSYEELNDNEYDQDGALIVKGERMNVDEDEFKSVKFTASNFTAIQSAENSLINSVTGTGAISLSPERDTNKASRRSPSLSPQRDRSPSPQRRQRQRRRSPSPERDQIPNDNTKMANTSAASTSNTGVKMADGTAAGLQSGKSIKQQLDAQKKAELLALEKSISMQGQEQKTVYRDTKTGKKVDLDIQRTEQLEKEKKRAAEDEAKRDWGRGIAQKREGEELKRRIEAEKKSALAVYADDRGLNASLKEKVRWGDAMAQHVPISKSKRRRAVYKGPPPPPNRYGILPGFRWDGVDRSNGFELKVFRSKVALKEGRKEYDRWAMEDM